MKRNSLDNDHGSYGDHERDQYKEMYYDDYVQKGKHKPNLKLWRGALFLFLFGLCFYFWDRVVVLFWFVKSCMGL